MDLTNLDTKTSAAKGAWLHLRHPALGHPMYSGPGADERTGLLTDKTKDHQKVRVYVVGTDSPAVKAQAKAANASAMHASDPEADEQRGLAFVCSLVEKVEGISTKDADGTPRPLTASKSDLESFFDQSDALVSQVLNFAQDRANFFDKPAKS